MKKIKIFYIISLLALFGACKNADELQHVVYFTGTEMSPNTRISIDGPSTMGLSITSSNIVEKEVIVKITPDNSLVETFNKKQKTNYVLLPSNAYELSSSQLVIDPGKNVSKPIEFRIKSIAEMEDNTTYCVPISITEVSGGFPILQSARTIYIIIDKTIITTAAYLGESFYEVPFNKDNSLRSVSNITMESRFYVKSFQASDPFISTLMGIEGDFLLRFGDVTIDKAQLQFTGRTFSTTTPTRFSTDKWYHVAAVYTANSAKIYINGKLEVEQSIDGTPIDLGWLHAIDHSGKQWGFCIGASGSGARHLDGYISEARVWKRALSADEIINNMCGVKPTSEGLVAYWKFNDASGNTIKDWTGNGWDLKSYELSPVTWIEGVRCPE